MSFEKKTKDSLREADLILAFFIFTIGLIVLLSMINISQVKIIHSNTETMYKHPLVVSSTSVQVQQEILKIHGDMKGIVLVSDGDINALVEQVNVIEKSIYKNLKIIKDNVLGEEGLVLQRELFELFKDWKPIRDEVISLVEKKEITQAIKIIKNKGAEHILLLEKYAIKLNEHEQLKSSGFERKSHAMFEEYEYLGKFLLLIFVGIFSLLSAYIYIRIKKYILKIHVAEKKLFDVNERLKYAINGTGDGLWDWNLITNEVYFSPRWKEMIGYKDEEMPSDFSSWEDNVHPDDLETTVDEILETQKIPNTPYRGVHRLKHKDGTWVWILDRGQTLFDEDGKAVRMLGFHTDITKTKMQELKIAELRDLLTNTINSFDNLVFVKDKSFRYIECNEAFENFIGMKKKSLLGKTDYDIFDKELADSFRSRDDEMLAKGETLEHYEWVTYSNGKKVYLMTSKSPLHDSDGNVFGLVGNSFDMTREKLLEDKLKDQEEIIIAQSRHAAMGEMISMIAHQWRQPISVISIEAAKILVDIELELVSDEELKKTASGIIHQTQELSKTIDDFRNFFKPEKLPVECFLEEIISDAMGIIGISLKNNDITFTQEMKKNIKIQTYSRELMQVIVNILKNAKEALVEDSVEEKNIRLHAFHNEDKITIQIYDNAKGINPSIIDKIFDPYFSTKGEVNGTGLGLYMSKTIVETHLQGEIRAFNKPTGACFELVLPASLETSGIYDD